MESVYPASHGRSATWDEVDGADSSKWCQGYVVSAHGASGGTPTRATMAWSVSTAWAFYGEHQFTLQAVASGVRFTQSERFSGILVPLFRRSLDTDTKRGFLEMNLALKRRAEHPAHAAA